MLLNLFRLYGSFSVKSPSEHFGDAHAASWNDLAVRGDIHFDRGAERDGLLEANGVGAGEQDA